MLVTSEEQMESMSVYMLEQFEDRMVQHLSTRFPEPTGAMSEQDLRSHIRKHKGKAKIYGVLFERDGGVATVSPVLRGR